MCFLKTVPPASCVLQNIYIVWIKSVYYEETVFMTIAVIKFPPPPIKEIKPFMGKG